MNNENFELIGIIGTEKFPEFIRLSNGHTHQSDERTVPILFKNLPLGTRLYLKVEDEQRVKKTLQTIGS